MITNIAHLIIYCILINLVSLGYISAVLVKTLSHDKNSGALYATNHNKNIGETYTKVMLGLNIFFLIGAFGFLFYVKGKDLSSEKGRIGKKGSIPFILFSLIYIILSSIWIENDMSSSQLINDQFLIYTIMGSLQFLLCLHFLYNEKGFIKSDLIVDGGRGGQDMELKNMNRGEEEIGEDNGLNETGGQDMELKDISK